MSNQEQDHLEKTLAILSKRLAEAQAQYRNTKKTIHLKKAFLLSSKTILQQDLGHVFKLDDQNDSVKRRRKRTLQGPPPGLVPLLSNKGLTHKETTDDDNGLTVTGCKGFILQDRIWLHLTVLPRTERISQAHLTWIAPPSTAWTPNELDRTTLHNIPAATASSQHQHVLYAATTIPPHLLLSPDQVEKMDINVAVRYIGENENWTDSSSVSIEWCRNHHWIMDDIENIQHWAPILYPYKLHLSPSSSTAPIDWISLGKGIHVASDASLLLIQGKADPFLPIQDHLFGLKSHALASWLIKNNYKNTDIIPWDGITLDSRQRLQHSIVSLVDQSQSSLSLSLFPSSQNRLANREHSLAQLSTLLSPSSSTSLFSK